MPSKVCMLEVILLWHTFGTQDAKIPLVYKCSEDLPFPRTPPTRPPCPVSGLPYSKLSTGDNPCWIFSKNIPVKSIVLMTMSHTIYVPAVLLSISYSIITPPRWFWKVTYQYIICWKGLFEAIESRTPETDWEQTAQIFGSKVCIGHSHIFFVSIIMCHRD